MFEFLIGIGEYLVAVLFLVCALGVIGSAVLTVLLRNALTTSSMFWLTAPGVGLGAFSIFTLIVTHLGSGITTWNVALLVASCGVVLFVLNREQLARTIRHASLITVGRLFGICALVGGVGLIPYIQLFTIGRFPVNFFTTPTWTNNDLGAYLQMSTNLMQKGLSDASLIRGWNPAPQSAFDHPAVLSVLAGVSRLFGAMPYQIGLVLMSTICIVCCLSTLGLVGHFGGQNALRKTGLLVPVVVTNPAIISAVANYFLAQMMTLGLLLTILALTTIWLSSSNRFSGLIPIGVCFAASFMTSVETAISLGLVMVVFSVLLTPSPSLEKVGFVIAAPVLALASLFALRTEFVVDQLRVLRRVSVGGIAGWQADYTSVTALSGFAPIQFGQPSIPSTRSLDLIILVAGAVVVTLIVRKERSLIRVVVLMAMILAAVLLGIISWGSNGYQTWKFITTSAGIFLCLLLVLISSMRGASRVIGLYLALMIGATISWSGFVWRDSVESSWVSPDLSRISREIRAQELDGVNVLLAPFFETMAASVMVGPNAHMSSPTYEFPAGQPLYFPCSLTTRNRIVELQEGARIIRGYGNYVLAGNAECGVP